MFRRKIKHSYKRAIDTRASSTLIKDNSYNILGENDLKEWTCVQVSHHNKIGEVIEEYQRDGWSLHTYQAQGTPTLVNHYLLFERER